MGYIMKQLLLFCSLIICFLAMTMNPGHIPQVKAYDGQLMESVMVEVNCTIGTVTTMSGLSSSNSSLVHFPSGVDLSDADLINVTSIDLMFSTAHSFLAYLFENTDNATAKTIADGFTSSISSAFSTSFVWFSTSTSAGVVNVTYTGEGKSDLATYVGWLVSQCLASDLGGFSLTFAPMSNEPGAFCGLAASKGAGNFYWIYYMGTWYATIFPAGSDDHLVDVLDLLDVSSLAPSNYAAEPEIGYSSEVIVAISSDSPIGFVSSEPENVSSQNERGWFLYPIPLPQYALMAGFSFDSDPSPQSPLTLTFSGVVVPEFTTTTLLVLFLVSAMAVLIVRKRFSK